MKEKKILVIGANGFIGKALTRILNEVKIQNVSHKDIGIDLTDRKSFDFDAANEITHVIHLGGKTFVPDSWIDPGEFIKVNVVGTNHVAEFCKKFGCHLIYISAYIYGVANTSIIGEDHPTNANNPYALSKKMAEEVCLFYKQYYGIECSIVRPFNVYGWGQKDSFLIPEIIKQVKNGIEVRLKDLTPKRDFIYVDDLAGLILKILETGEQGIFNAGYGKSYSVQQVVDMVQKFFGTNLPVFSSNEKRQNEISETVADISKAKRKLGWEPAIDLEFGIKKILEQYN